MADIDEINTRLAYCILESEKIKSKIKEIAQNKGIQIQYDVDTPLSLLSKIDANTVAVSNS